MSDMGQKQWEEYLSGFGKKCVPKICRLDFFSITKIFRLENIFVEKFSQPKKIENSRKIENVEKSKKVEKSRKNEKFENFDFFDKKKPKKIRPHFFVNEKIEKSKKKKQKQNKIHIDLPIFEKKKRLRELGDELQTDNLWKRQLKLPSALRGRF